MHLPFSSVRHENNAFYDTVCTFKTLINVLKEHIFVKRVQTDAYNKHKAELSDGDSLFHVDFSESYRNNEQNESEIKAFCSLHRVVLLKVQQAR